MHYLRLTKPDSCKSFRSNLQICVFGGKRLDGLKQENGRFGLSMTRLLIFVVLRILLRDQRVELLLLFWSQQGANSCPCLHTWFFEAWSQFGAQRSIFVARFIEDRADRGGLLISQVQFSAHLFEALVHRALTRFRTGATGARSIESGERRAGHAAEHEYH